MDTSVQLFRYGQRLTAIGLGEPSITLIENDTAFSVLLAEAARDDSHSERLHFDQVSIVRIRGESWHFHESQLVTIRQISNGTWIVQDALSGKLYHEPSAVPYHVIFISASDYRRMIIAKNQDRPRPIFDYAKEQFGYLPGFSFAQDTLKTPDEYACAADLVSGFEFVTEK